MVLLSRLFAWQNALINVKPETFLGWHRKGFQLLWRWKSRPRGRLNGDQWRSLLPLPAFAKDTRGQQCDHRHTTVRHSNHFPSVSYRDIAVMTICLQQRNGRDHRCDNQHIGERVRQHLLHDLFRLLCQFVVCNQCSRLLLGRRMAS
jgi:hypothetical protein